MGAADSLMMRNDVVALRGSCYASPSGPGLTGGPPLSNTANVSIEEKRIDGSGGRCELDFERWKR